MRYGAKHAEQKSVYSLGAETTVSCSARVSHEIHLAHPS